MKIYLPIRARSSIVRHACAFTQEKDSKRSQRKCRTNRVYLYRSARPAKCRFGAIKIRRKAIAQPGSLNFRQVGRKQRWKSTGSKVIGRSSRRDRSPGCRRSLAELVTTVLSLAARDFIVVGCDSLATTSTKLVHPYDITSVYFEPDGKLKVDADGQPLLQRAQQIWEKSNDRPIDQLPSVTKLYDLAPLNACALFAGSSRIGNTTIAHIVDTFLMQSKIKKRTKDYTMGWIARRFKEFVMAIYDKEVPMKTARSAMEVILSGYSAKHRQPELWRLPFAYDHKKSDFDCDVSNTIKRGDYNVIFGGQYDVIQRVVNGIDSSSFWAIKERAVAILNDYHDEVQAQVHSVDPALDIPKPNFWDKKFDIFERDAGGVTRLFPDVGSLSEQAGIDFIYFLVDVMIKAQQFATRIPTVGGKIHVGLLTKNALKLRWISEEGFTYEHKHIPKYA